jgi:predicted GTPase
MSTILAVIGKTGAGKSSFCNKIMGNSHFKVGSSMMEGVTQETTFADVRIFGDLYRVIDTQGSCDPQGKDYHNSQQMLKVMKE